VLQRVSLLGKKFIDSDGNVAKVMRRVKPDTHVDQVLAALLR
jgi:peroxiredoxin